MALFHCTFKSKILEQAAQFNMIIPEECREDIPTVYLLHGLSGNQDDWIRYTSIERYANDHNMAVAMPSADMSYFTDMKYGHKFFTYVSEEFIDYTRHTFRLSRKREKTFIGGMSMGGYVALKIALSKPETFKAVASISGVTDIYYRFSIGGNEEAAKANWGENYLDQLKDTDNDLYVLANRVVESRVDKPWIFQSIGTEDYLYETNLRFKKFMDETDFVYEFHEGPGAHSWEVGDYWAKHAMDFFAKALK